MPLLQQLDAASFTTYAGRGVVDRAYPLHFGSLLARSGAKSVLGSADLVLVIGSELSEGDLWRADLGHKAPLIRVDLDPEVLTDSHQAELAILMRAEAFVPALLSQLQGHKAQTVWRAQEIQTQRRAWQRQVDLELWDMRCPLLLEVRLAAPVCRGQRLSEITDFNIPCRNWALQLSSDYRFRLSYGTTPSCRKLKIV
jgi:acetolactate synthase-1/2/3 large subunit/5-guanidino-2-oxopentanoate decarboxylase